MTADTAKRIGYLPGIAVENNITCFLREHASEQPDKPVFIWSKKDNPGADYEISFGDLYKDVSTLANNLQALGVSEGDRVLVFMPMSHRLYTTVFAVQMLGAAAVFLDSWARTDELAHVLKIANPCAVVSTPAICNSLSKLPEYNPDCLQVHVQADETTKATGAKELEELLKGESELEPVALANEATALITFTTGSSGSPKGANRTHRFLASQHYALRECIPHLAEDLELTAFPIFALNNIAGGVTTLLPAIDLSAQSVDDGTVLLEQIKNAKASTATISPSMLRSLLSAIEDSSDPAPPLRRVITGGAPISADDAQRVKNACSGTELVVLYGSTEVEPIAEITGTNMLADAKSAEADMQGVNVGKIHDALTFRFIEIGLGEQERGVNLADLAVAKGEVGELIVSGEHVCKGYINDENAFFRSKIEDETGTVWHRTGDLGRLNAAGDLFLVGRVHSAFKREGKWLFPVLAEVVLKRTSGVKHAAYLALDKNAASATAVVALQLQEGMDSAGLTEKVKVALDSVGIPFDTLVTVASMPLDPRHHSKVQYDDLRKLIQSGKAEELA